MMSQKRDLSVAVIGAGYFGRFHIAAWQQAVGAALIAVCDRDHEKVATAGIADAQAYADVDSMLSREAPDVVDIVAPPDAHADLVRATFAKGRVIICQKPFCRSLAEATQVASEAEAAGTMVIIHENFRFQPWHRTLKHRLDDGLLGKVFEARFLLRPGDGRGPDAYLSRQPIFQEMPRFLFRETGVHFIDLFRWLFGPIGSVYAETRRLNPAIAGEDEGIMVFNHEGGTRSIFDGNRLVDHVANDPRRTMGELAVDGEAGTLRIDGNGVLSLRRFGQQADEPVSLDIPVIPDRFGGGCVHYLIQHVVDSLVAGTGPENQVQDYLAVLAVSEAAYLSAQDGRRVQLPAS